jgi:hypothetical protein
MKMFLHSIARNENGLLNVSVSYGVEPARNYQATFDGSDAEWKLCSIDQELFMTLSNLAYKRFGNCTVYQMELMGIIAAFSRGEPLPTLPAELGTTAFCTLKPSLPRVLWNKFIILLTKMRIYRPRIWVNPDIKKLP